MLGVDGAICSRGEVDSEGRYTGRMAFYAYGPEKAEAMRELAERTGIDLGASSAYSDSATDLPMLEAVGRPVAVNADRALAKVARDLEQRGARVTAVAGELAALRVAGGGWINLLPGIDEEASDVHPRTGLFAFFGNNAAPVTMTTLMPPKKDRSETEGVTVGLMHPTGGKAVARLAVK